jgi:hypothetical protein
MFIECIFQHSIIGRHFLRQIIVNDKVSLASLSVLCSTSGIVASPVRNVWCRVSAQRRNLPQRAGFRQMPGTPPYAEAMVVRSSRSSQERLFAGQPCREMIGMAQRHGVEDELGEDVALNRHPRGEWPTGKLQSTEAT